MIRDVPGFYNKYKISIGEKECKCISVNYQGHGFSKELSNHPDKNGRLNWVLYKHGKGIVHQAAWWVAITFPELVENEYFEGAEIDHIDTNPLNNHPSNLKWVSHSGNMLNPTTRKHLSSSKTGEKHPMYGKHQTERTKKAIGAHFRNRKDQSKPVIQFKLDGTYINTWPSLNEIRRNTDFSMGNIGLCCQGKRKQAYGYKWEYEKREDV